MAPPRVYASPTEQLVVLLREARARGVMFEVAWDLAFHVAGDKMIVTTTPDFEKPAGAIVWPRDHKDRMAWWSAIRATKDAWRRSYENVPQTSGETALFHLVAALSEADERPLPQVAAAA
jgi:hypothetical protein